MAEQSEGFEFVAVDAKDIIENRQQEWQRFTKFASFAIGAIVLALVLLLVFVA